MRQVVLDTETTGLEPSRGHRIIEIGCVELENRRLTGRHYHQYIQPDREIDEGAIEVHGITNESLADKPRFVDIAEDFITFVRGAELIIHNAPFDVGFLDHELHMLGDSSTTLAEYCTVLDTLVLARKLHPGQKNSLDALCKRYQIDNSHREVHGALLDAELLAEVYLAMTGGQVKLSLGDSVDSGAAAADRIRRLPSDRCRTPVLRANDAELAAHERRIDGIRSLNGGACVWDGTGETEPESR